MRALCESGVLFHMSHLKLHFALHNPHFTLPTALFALHTPHFTLETSQSTLHTAPFILHTSQCTLHTSLFMPHTSHWTLHTPHFISSELFSPYPSSSLLISSLLICHLSFHESLPSTTTKELACAVRQPGPCVRALCESGVLFHMSHLKRHFALHTSHCTLHTPHCTLHTSHFTLHTSHFTLHSSQSTLHTSHFTLHTSHFTIHTSHFSLLIAFFTLHTSHSTLHTALFTPHTSHCTLHTPHFISSELFSPYPSSSLLISSLLICHLSFHESLPSTTTKELACAVRQPGRCVRALCEAVAVLLSKNMTCARPRYNANTFLTLHIALFTPTLHTCTSSQLISSELFSSHSMSSHVSAKFFLAIFMSSTSQY